jgi:hypothetical protein
MAMRDRLLALGALGGGAARVRERASEVRAARAALEHADKQWFAQNDDAEEEYNEDEEQELGSDSDSDDEEWEVLGLRWRVFVALVLLAALGLAVAVEGGGVGAGDGVYLPGWRYAEEPAVVTVAYGGAMRGIGAADSVQAAPPRVPPQRERERERERERVQLPPAPLQPQPLPQLQPQPVPPRRRRRQAAERNSVADASVASGSGQVRPAPLPPRYASRLLGAPRTLGGGQPRGEEVALARPEAKLVVFQPSGGFNNQRIILERALRICRTLARTCVVPMAGRHSSMFSSYNRLDTSGLMEMDRVLDFAHLRRYGARVAPLSEPFPAFLERLRGQVPDEREWIVVNQTRKEMHASPLSFHNLTEWRRRPERVLFLAGGTMWQHFAREFEKPVWPFVRYAPFWRAIALDATRGLRLGRNYACIHSRSADHGEKWESWMAKKQLAAKGGGGASTNATADGAAAPAPVPVPVPAGTVGDKFVHQGGFSSQYLPSADGMQDVGAFLLQQLHWAMRNLDIPTWGIPRLYIATKPGVNYKAYGNLTKELEVLFSPNVPAQHLAAFEAVFAPAQARLRNDMLGVVEQLLCARARLFIGFKGSSFAEYIVRMRGEPTANLELPDANETAARQVAQQADAEAEAEAAAQAADADAAARATEADARARRARPLPQLLDVAGAAPPEHAATTEDAAAAEDAAADAAQQRAEEREAAALEAEASEDLVALDAESAGDEPPLPQQQEEQKQQQQQLGDLALAAFDAASRRAALRRRTRR